MQGVFYGIGVGPGDPELLTCKAVRLLGEVDLIAVPVAEKDGKSTAFKIARPYIGSACRVMEIDFPMTRDKALLEEAWQVAREGIREALDRGKKTAFLTLGDPMLYSTYSYLYHHLKTAGYRTCTVPGINSFSAAAAVAGVPLTFGDEKMAIIPGSAAAEISGEILAGFQTLVIFKVARAYKEIIAALKEADRLEGSVLVINCGQPGERIVTDLEGMKRETLSYFSLIISRKEPVL